MADFAKLFNIDGVGQVLVTLGSDDDGPACIFRIPDCGDAQLSMNIEIHKINDTDAEWEFASKVFAAVNAATVVGAIKPLLELRDRMIAEGDVT